jgi:DNA-binding transcriptional regulator YiaG
MQIQIDCGNVIRTIYIDNGRLEFRDNVLYLKSNNIVFGKKQKPNWKELLHVTEFYKSNGQKLREFREQYGITQKQVAAMVPNMTQSMISHYETGRNQCPFWLIPHLTDLVVKKGK